MKRVVVVIALFASLIGATAAEGALPSAFVFGDALVSDVVVPPDY